MFDIAFNQRTEVKDALRERADFLAEQGLAEHRGQRVVLARNLLATLRGRELAQAAKDIAAETGLEHRPVADGQRMAGICRRSVMLASGRYAMLDDGMGFSGAVEAGDRTEAGTAARRDGARWRRVVGDWATAWPICPMKFIGIYVFFASSSTH